MAGPQRFFDPSQPQTLQIATFLLYLDAVLLVFGARASPRLGLLIAVGSAGAPTAWPTSKKWGYGLSVGIAFFGCSTRSSGARGSRRCSASTP